MRELPRCTPERATPQRNGLAIGLRFETELVQHFDKSVLAIVIAGSSAQERAPPRAPSVNRVVPATLVVALGQRASKYPYKLLLRRFLARHIPDGFVQQAGASSALSALRIVPDETCLFEVVQMEPRRGHV